MWRRAVQIVTGLALIAFYFLDTSQHIPYGEIAWRTIVIDGEVVVGKGRRSKFEYKFSSRTSDTTYVILIPGGIAAGWTSLKDRLSSGDSVDSWDQGG
jgi:hypothetical protein